MAVEVFAPAKINLTLHVTGRRDDGYHLLDSLVAFADIGDRVSVEAADALRLTIDGPEGRGLPTGDDNLVLKAARLFDPDCRADIRLTKNLPVASGIGGGSADAAATIRALVALHDHALPPSRAIAALGADIPACLISRALRLRGIGEELTPVPTLPALDVVMVNPRLPVSTPSVFAALTSRENRPMPGRLPDWGKAEEFCDWLGTMRNDLYAPAAGLVPEIDAVLGALRDTGCLFAGMSGSGATCFGLYRPGNRSAKDAWARIGADHPGWWAAVGSLS